MPRKKIMTPVKPPKIEDELKNKNLLPKSSGSYMRKPKTKKVSTKPNAKLPKVSAGALARQQIKEQEREAREQLRALSKQITKQSTRAKKLVKSMMRRGYEFNEGYINFNRENTKEYLEYLKSINRKTIYDNAYYINYDTGEYFSGEERRSEERRQAYYKGRNAKQLKENRVSDKTIAVLEEHRRFLSYLPPTIRTKERVGRGYWRWEETPFGTVLTEAFERAVEQNGEIAVARALEENAGELEDLKELVGNAYKYTMVSSLITRFKRIYNQYGNILTSEESENMELAADMLQGFQDLPEDMIPEQWR